MTPTRRRKIVAVLAALPVLGILCWLGTWQLQRLAWKEAMLARIADSMRGLPVPLYDEAELFTRVVAVGRFDHAREALLGVEARNGVLGTQVVTPLLRQGAPPVLVVRGWVPFDAVARLSRPTDQVEVTGWVRPSEPPGRFAATDEPQNRRFYNFDIPAIAASMGLRRVEPFGLVALSDASYDGSLPEPALRLPQLSNDHLGYAITWYGLALSLVGVLAFYLRGPKARREPPSALARRMGDPGGGAT